MALRPLPLHSVYHAKTGARPQLSNVSSSKFKWIEEKTWGEKQLEFFLFERSKLFTPQFCHPDKLSGKTKNKGSFVERWLLVNNDFEPLLCSEAHVFETSYKCVHLQMFSEKQKTDDVTYMREALSLLTSAYFLGREADLVKINTTDEYLYHPLERLDVSAIEKSIWSPLKDFAMPWSIELQQIGVFSKQWSFSAALWWELEQSQKDRRDLGYLQARKENFLKKKKYLERKKTTKRSGFFSRMLRTQDK